MRVRMKPCGVPPRVRTALGAVLVEIDKPSQDDTGCGCCPSMAATGAETVELQSVGLDHKAVLCRDFFLQPFNFAILELHNGATAGTDEMIVMAFVRDVVVLRLGAEVSRLGDPGFAEEVQSAINGGQSQMGIFLRQLMVHRFCRHVLLPEKRRQDQLSLTSQFQLVLGQVLAKHVHFFEGFAHGM